MSASEFDISHTWGGFFVPAAAIIYSEVIFVSMKEEIEKIRERDPAAKSAAEIYLLYPGFKAVRAYRRANWFYRRNMFFIARFISQLSRHKTGIEIHPGAKIGKNLFIDHGMGVVIGETAEIGDNCTLYHGVTLGGTGKDTGKRHPTLGDNVYVGAHAQILGPVNIGENCKIAASAVVIDDIPPNCTAVGAPAKIVKRNGNRCGGNKKITKEEQMDSRHIPDPVTQSLCALEHRIRRLEKGEYNCNIKKEEDS